MGIQQDYDRFTQGMPVLTSSSGSSFAQHQKEYNFFITSAAEQLLAMGYSYNEVAGVIPDLDIRIPTAKGMGLSIEEQNNFVGDYSANPLDYVSVPTQQHKNVYASQEMNGSLLVLGLLGYILMRKK